MRPNSVTGSKNNQISMSLEPEVWGKPPPPPARYTHSPFAAEMYPK